MSRLRTPFDIQPQKSNFVSGQIIRLEQQGSLCHMEVNTIAGVLHHILPLSVILDLKITVGQPIEVKLTIEHFSICALTNTKSFSFSTKASQTNNNTRHS